MALFLSTVKTRSRKSKLAIHLGRWITTFEGTRSTLAELLSAKAGKAVERSPEDLREVGKFVLALEYIIERIKTLPLSLQLARELHEKVMTGYCRHFFLGAQAHE